MDDVALPTSGDPIICYLLAVTAARQAFGRPPITTHAAIERAAFALFDERGFEATTIDDIADAVGIARRTLFRYYQSKNDIPWGQFKQTLGPFREMLEQMPTDIPLHVAVHRGVVQFNSFPPEAEPSHRHRMRLILETPALQAHSVLRYADWRAVIADYVAARLFLRPDNLLPQTVAQVSLALALTAYNEWLARPDAKLPDLLDATMAGLRSYLA